MVNYQRNSGGIPQETRRFAWQLHQFLSSCVPLGAVGHPKLWNIPSCITLYTLRHAHPSGTCDIILWIPPSSPILFWMGVNNFFSLLKKGRRGLKLRVQCTAEPSPSCRLSRAWVCQCLGPRAAQLSKSGPGTIKPRGLKPLSLLWPGIWVNLC